MGCFTRQEKNYFIERSFKFKNYTDSEKFILEVGKIAEKEGHHPDISFDGVMQKSEYQPTQLKDWLRVILF